MILPLALALSVLLIFSCNKGKLIEEKTEKQKEEIVQPKKDSSWGNTANKYPGPCPYPCGDTRCDAYSEPPPGCEGGGGTPTITAYYAGIQIKYETSNGILKFNSTTDINTVLDQLDVDYETYNDNYENQYPTLSADQLDSVDQQTGFDEFRKFRDFEALFSGFVSKRSQIESTENTWLLNNFTGTDPDTIDYTFDDAENTIFNSNHSFKVGSNVYQLRSDGLYINGIFQDDGAGEARMFSTVCKSNKKSKAFPTFDNNTRRFKIKVAINSIAVRSGVHGKVVHYKNKNGNWKRSRTEMAVGCAGTIYNGSCTSLFQFSDRKPFSGYSKRKQLATRRHTQAQPPSNSTIWKTNSGEVASSFSTPNTSIAGTLLLTF